MMAIDRPDWPRIRSSHNHSPIRKAKPVRLWTKLYFLPQSATTSTKSLPKDSTPSVIRALRHTEKPPKKSQINPQPRRCPRFTRVGGPLEPASVFFGPLGSDSPGVFAKPVGSFCIQVQIKVSSYSGGEAFKVLRTFYLGIAYNELILNQIATIIRMCPVHKNLNRG